ncbi:MAG TPA: cyclic nucleotide-binding domain-containing protein [Candidatus Acidoferrales bacterium]|nr:cyclic nucleotide-binding domain-containing protein [Candidatus Acidoferrales bacterium]
MSLDKPDTMRFFGADMNAQKFEMLKNIPIFHELSRKEILEVDELLHERVYDTGEIVFDEGDPGHGVYIIVSGKLRADPSHRLLKNTVLDFGPGELMGELSLFDEAPRTAKVIAIERTVTVALFQAEFSSLLLKNKNIGVKVLVEIARTLSRRARQLLLQEKHLPSL